MGGQAADKQIYDAKYGPEMERLTPTLQHRVKRKLYQDYFCSWVRNQSRAKLRNISCELMLAGTGTQGVSVFDSGEFSAILVMK